MNHSGQPKKPVAGQYILVGLSKLSILPARAPQTPADVCLLQPQGELRHRKALAEFGRRLKELDRRGAAGFGDLSAVRSGHGAVSNGNGGHQ